MPRSPARARYAPRSPPPARRPPLARSRHLADVLRPRPDELLAAVLLDGVADPADAAADGEDGQGGSGRELQRPGQSDQCEVDGRLLLDHLTRRLDDLGG